MIRNKQKSAIENIYKRKDGRWEARYIRGYGSDGRAQLGYCYAATYKEVKDKRNQIILDSGRFVPVSKRSGNILFGDLCDEWLVYIRGNVRESSFGVYRTAVRALGKCRSTVSDTRRSIAFRRRCSARKSFLRSGAGTYLQYSK